MSIRPDVLIEGVTEGRRGVAYIYGCLVGVVLSLGVRPVGECLFVVGVCLVVVGSYPAAF